MSEVRFFGIRHHGPGSARALEQGLLAFAPTHVLLEGPEEMADEWQWLMDEQMRPPVALMAYVHGDPTRSVMLPVAEYSPELIALRHVHEQGVKVRFFDLAAKHTLAMVDQATVDREPGNPSPTDPLGWIAEIAGHSDGEQWWNRFVEERAGSEELFAHIAELMAAAREERGEPTDARELAREAFMRQSIRAAAKEPDARIAVVCGAWHVPALRKWSEIKASTDASALKSLPKVKILTAWVPWSYARLAAVSGYGAGVVSPAYYEMVWRRPGGDLPHAWCLRAARLLREHGHPASPAHAIEAVRLAEALAALRGWSRAGLVELQEAAFSVLVEAKVGLMRLIEDQLIIGSKVGSVPGHMPGLPLLKDFHQEAKQLKLKTTDDIQRLELDLREPLGIRRSWMLHRCHLLGLFEGKKLTVWGAKGTFREEWELRWRQDLEVRVVFASRWGNTICEAADCFSAESARQAKSLAELTEILEDVLLAKLDRGFAAVVAALESITAVASDVSQILAGLPALARAMRYGDVRETETAPLRHAFETLFARANVGLVAACASLGDEAAEQMALGLSEMSRSVPLLESKDHVELWRQSSLAAMRADTTHGLVAGRLCDLMSDAQALSPDEVRRELSHALDPGTSSQRGAAWIEGFLGSSGAPLIHDEEMFKLVDAWLTEMLPSAFDDALPLLRRTFSRFSPSERRLIGARAQHGFDDGQEHESQFDPERLRLVQPVLHRLLGREVDV